MSRSRTDRSKEKQVFGGGNIYSACFPSLEDLVVNRYQMWSEWRHSSVCVQSVKTTTKHETGG